jgi:hypothetical protein
LRAATKTNAQVLHLQVGLQPCFGVMLGHPGEVGGHERRLLKAGINTLIAVPGLVVNVMGWVGALLSRADVAHRDLGVAGEGNECSWVWAARTVPNEVVCTLLSPDVIVLENRVRRGVGVGEGWQWGLALGVGALRQ